jgi:hypothetical protein
LKGLPPDDWLRPAWHEEFGRVTVTQQVSYFARHERDHWRQIRRLREQVCAG